MTKLAVLADIHGNSQALKAVFADIERQGGADHIIVLGDLAVFGPDPRGVLQLLQQKKSIIYVRGNTDRYLVEAQYPTGSSEQSWEAQVLASFPWTAEQLGQRGLAFLASFRPQQMLHLSFEHVVLAVHGSPRSDEENILPDTSDTDLATMMVKGPSYNLLLCGHTHRPVDRMVNGRRVVNVGSTGLPFDGDQRSSYALIDLASNGEYRVECRRVAYDVETVIDQLISIAHPTAEISAYNLRTARPMGQKLVYTKEMRRGLGRKTGLQRNKQFALRFGLEHR